MNKLLILLLVCIPMVAKAELDIQLNVTPYLYQQPYSQYYAQPIVRYYPQPMVVPQYYPSYPSYTEYYHRDDDRYRWEHRRHHWDD